MDTDHFGPFSSREPRFVHGYNSGSFGRRGGGRSAMPYVAAAFIARAMFEKARRGYDGGAGEARGPWGRPGWGHDAHEHGHGHGHGRHGGPRGFGRGHDDESGGAPWETRGPWARGRGRGGWGGDAQDFQQAREAFRTLRPEVGAIVASLRDAARRGALDARRLSEIKAVLSETRTRISAILAENGTTTNL